MAFYRIRDLGMPLDGLVVEGEWRDWPGEGDVLCITRLIRPDSIVGDRQVIFPIEPDSLFIPRSKLIEVEDPTGRQFAHDNPYGKCLGEMSQTMGSVQVSAVKHERGCTVKVRDTSANRTLFDHHFKSPHVFDDVSAGLAMAHVDGATLSPEEIVFELQEARDGENLTEIVENREQN